MREGNRSRAVIDRRIGPSCLRRLLPRNQWRSFLITPETLLPWHREASKRKMAALATTTRSLPATNERRGDRAHRPSGSREPTLGMCRYPGRATKARY
jgi:hypothetical protein